MTPLRHAARAIRPASALCLAIALSGAPARGETLVEALAAA